MYYTGTRGVSIISRFATLARSLGVSDLVVMNRAGGISYYDDECLSDAILGGCGCSLVCRAEVRYFTVVS